MLKTNPYAPSYIIHRQILVETRFKNSNLESLL